MNNETNNDLDLQNVSLTTENKDNSQNTIENIPKDENIQQKKINDTVIETNDIPQNIVDNSKNEQKEELVSENNDISQNIAENYENIQKDDVLLENNKNKNDLVNIQPEDEEKVESLDLQKDSAKEDVVSNEEQKELLENNSNKQKTETNIDNTKKNNIFSNIIKQKDNILQKIPFFNKKDSTIVTESPKIDTIHKRHQSSFDILTESQRDESHLFTLGVKNLIKRFGAKTAVNNASFSMKQGEIVGLLGPNGAGKTTIFYMIVGFIKPTTGNIFLDDQVITNLQMFKRAHLGISYLAQESSIFRKLSVEQNIDSVLEILDIPKEEKKRRKDEVIEDLGIGRLVKQKAYSLSGGERRRTEIARALVLKPKFLLLDEPFAGVDPIAVSDIQTIVAGLKDKNIGVLITDHNVRETLRITDRAYIINLGNIFRSGNSYELVNDQMVRKLYLGENFSF